MSRTMEGQLSNIFGKIRIKEIWIKRRNYSMPLSSRIYNKNIIKINHLKVIKK
jgi:hypothetical protein